MSFEILHFRESHRILEEKYMTEDVSITMDQIDKVLAGVIHKREIMRLVLDEMGWIGDNGSRRFLDGRRYEYKGYKKGVALEGNLAAYEFILEGLFRLQIGFDKGLIDAGILFLNAKRSEKSPYGETTRMVKEEVDMLYPTISLPVSITLFELEETMLE